MNASNSRQPATLSTRDLQVAKGLIESGSLALDERLVRTLLVTALANSMWADAWKERCEALCAEVREVLMKELEPSRSVH